MGLGPTPNPGANRSVSEDRPCDPLGGRYSRERLAGRWISTLAFPTRILPDGPPNLGARLRGTPGVLGVTLLLRVLLVTWYRFLPIFQIRSTGVFSPWLLFTMTTFVFSETVACGELAISGVYVHAPLATSLLRAGRRFGLSVFNILKSQRCET